MLEKNEISKEVVTVGSKVILKDLDTKESNEFTIVGFVEADPSNHRISNESPVGQAIIGKKAGDQVTVNCPQGAVEYEIIKIKK